MQKFNAI